jgi:uncharacterized membrane protein
MMTPLGIFHTVMGLLSLVTGFLIFITAKGTKAHKLIGYTYIACMLLLNGTALMIYRVFGGFGPFHVLAIVSLLSLLRGYLPAYRKQPRGNWLAKHYEGIGWSYIGLLAATAAEIVSRGPWVRGFGAAFGLSVFAASTVVAVIGAWVLYRYRARTIGRARDNLSGESK